METPSIEAQEHQSTRSVEARSTRARRLIAAGVLSSQLLSLTMTDSDGTPFVCLETQTPPISSDALDAMGPIDPETGLPLRPDLANRPSSDEEFENEHKDVSTAANHPERQFNPIRGYQTMETLLTDLEQETSTRLPRSGLRVNFHTTSDWNVEVEALEEYMFFGFDHLRLIPNPKTRQLMECYRGLIFDDGVLNNRVLNVHISPRPQDCFEDLGIRLNTRAECDSRGLSLPRPPRGEYRMFIAPSVREPGLAHLNERMQTSFIHELTHIAQYAGGKPLFPFAELEANAYEVEEVMALQLKAQPYAKRHFTHKETTKK